MCGVHPKLSTCVYVDGIKASNENVLYQHNKTIRKSNYSVGTV